MKFARYLEETQTPEWKKAYIDYRGLKKRITAIRKSQQALPVSSSEEELEPSAASAQDRPSFDQLDAAGAPRSSLDTTLPVSGSRPAPTPLENLAGTSHKRHASEARVVLQIVEEQDGVQSGPAKLEHGRITDSPTRTTFAARPPIADALGRSPRGRSNTVTSVFSRALHRGSSMKGSDSGPVTGPRFDARHPLPLMELLPQLTPVEHAFFEKLDHELDKVESFYCERERDMRHRAKLLMDQLEELQSHRRAFYDAHRTTATPYSWLPLPLPAPVLPNAIRRRVVHQGAASHPRQLLAPPQKSNKSRASSIRRRSGESNRPVHSKDGTIDLNHDNGRVQHPESAGVDETSDAFKGEPGNLEADPAVGPARPALSWGKSMSTSVQALFHGMPPPKESKPGDHGSDGEHKDEGDTQGSGSSGSGRSAPGSPKKEPKGLRYNPEEYQHAKKQLKKAVLECYRGLEVLNNYRTLNLIGFRKALKKFEKVSHIPAQLAYTKEKIEPSAFSSGATVDALIRDMEVQFAARFARGDKKKAVARLRGSAAHTSHHFSTFRTGMALGLAMPALVAGLYQSFREETRQAISGWDGLLLVYGIFFVPTFFTLLVGANLLVWARTRINYVFIFELDLRTKMDYREYFEMPAFLLSLLCYAFWLSFSRIGAVAPTTWPLIWLAFALFVIVDPLPIMSKPSRWWLLRNISRLLTSGTHRVEFADFWMGDQFCSLIFTLSNLYFVGCLYAEGFDPDWRKCTANPGPRWGIAFLLGSLPLLVRLVQSVKRYVDSGLITHLINGGKYGSGILYYLFYFLWRAQEGRHGAIFVVWCVFATNYSIYAGAWDLLMDWSLLRPHVPYPLLRKDLLYSNNVPFYYFAIVSNTLIRFIWVLYIPSQGPNFVIRTFIVGLLEVLRRLQWNFLRLENEHIGNVDQYRVTREVPLPYSHDDAAHDSDGDEEEDARPQRGAAGRSWRVGRKPHSAGSDATAGAAAEVGAVDA